MREAFVFVTSNVFQHVACMTFIFLVCIIATSSLNHGYLKKNMCTTQKKYSIVEFSDGLQIIPSCWMNKYAKESIWPSHVKSQYTLDKLISKAVVPSGAETWDTCNIKRIFGSADTWERAQKKLAEAIETSTICDSEDFSEEEWRSQMKKQRRNHARKLFESDGSSDEGKESTMHRRGKVPRNQKCHYGKKQEQISSQTKLLPSLPTELITLSLQSSVPHLLYEASTLTSTQDKLQCTVQTNKTASNMLTASTSRKSLLSNFSKNSDSLKEVPAECNIFRDLSDYDFKKFVVKSIMTLLKRTKSFNDRMTKVEENQQMQVLSEENNIVNDEDITLPFQTEEQLLEFDEKLKNPTFFKKMISFLKMIGGDKVTLATNAILSRLITDILATKYSWQGKKGKKAFVKLLTAKLIERTVRTIRPEFTNAQIIEAASIWLAQAATRVKRFEVKRQISLMNNDSEIQEDLEENNEIENDK